MKFNKKSIYIGLFGILYLIVAFSSFFHACAFFGLANNSWMSIILAFAFEVGQAAVLFSLLTSTKDRSRIMPWVLMTMFTLVQVIGKVYSSYKYIITNSVENLRYFKEPIFIWTDLPDAQANVIIVYLVGALLPIAALLLTSMITNYLSDQSEETNALVDVSEKEQENTHIELKDKDEQYEEDGPLEGEGLSDKQVIDNLNATLDNRDEEINNLKKELENLRKNKTQFDDENLDVKTNEDETVVKDETTEDNPSINIEKDEENNEGKEVKKDSHFINL